MARDFGCSKNVFPKGVFAGGPIKTTSKRRCWQLTNCNYCYITAIPARHRLVRCGEKLKYKQIYRDTSFSLWYIVLSIQGELYAILWTGFYKRRNQLDPAINQRSTRDQQNKDIGFTLPENKLAQTRWWFKGHELPGCSVKNGERWSSYSSCSSGKAYQTI